MMKPTLFASLALLGLLTLAGCSAPEDPPPSAHASVSAQRTQLSPGQAQLDTHLTHADARKAAVHPGTAYQQGQSALVASGQALAIDTTDREAVRLFYNRLYLEPPVPIGWTGSHASGTAGATSAAFQASTLQRLNWYRAMAGLPAATTLSAEHSAKAQEAALMMSANNTLSHTPPSTWKFYSAAGAQAAGSSNLALGNIGPDAITAYMHDFGDNNAAVGHRRWILYPQTRSFGTGDVPGMLPSGGAPGINGANALWVFDGNYGSARPRVRDEFVAWPSKGYVPYQVVFPRWSLSYPGADFSQARVAVTRDGQPVGVTLEPVFANSAGENTIVWLLASSAPNGAHARPEADLAYRVTVSNVVVGGQVRSFSYDVTVFDPAVAAPSALTPSVSAPPSVLPGQAYTVQVGALHHATGYSLRSWLRKPMGAANVPGFDAGNWTVAHGGTHSLFGPGVLNFYMEAGGANMQEQTAVLNRKLSIGSAGASVSVTRTVRLTSPKQRFHVQVSVDDGSSWSDIHLEAGRVSNVDATAHLKLSLERYAGRHVRLRLMADQVGEAYLGRKTGWTVSSIAFEGVGELADEREYRSADGVFHFTAGQPGTYVFSPRIELQGLYYGDDGMPVQTVVEGAVLHGPRAAYTLTRRDGVLTIVDNTGLDGTQTVRNPFRLDFTDLTLAFDIDGNAGKAYRLYRAAFNRKPDAAGLGFWIRSMDGGLALEPMAREFATSTEFASLVGAAPTHQQVVTALYWNVLHRVPDAAGAAYWLDQMARGMRVERVLAEFSESAENKQQVAAEVEGGIGFTRQ